MFAKQALEHAGHNIKIAYYGDEEWNDPESVTLECLYCGMVLDEYEFEKELEYIDEYPDRVAEYWDESMDALGHNVTSHIREHGPCERCDELRRIQ